MKFDKVSEVSERKSDISKGYMNIKSVEDMSDQEVSDFIAVEFEKAHDEAEIDTYDKLLSEVFNRSEEEFDIDFYISDRIMVVLDKFRAEVWKTVDSTDRISAIREMVKTVGKEMGLDKLPEILISEDEDDAYGFYDPEKNVIMLNGNFLSDPTELVNTIAHELRHAYQHLRAEILETWEDALYKVNFENYISPQPLPAGGCLFFTDYMDQYVEVDARAFANLFTEAMR